MPENRAETTDDKRFVRRTVPARLAGWGGKGSSPSELRGYAMLCGHLVKLLGKVQSHKQISWAKAGSMADQYGPNRPIDLNWLCARPGAGGLTLKSDQKFSFSHGC